MRVIPDYLNTNMALTREVPVPGVAASPIPNGSRFYDGTFAAITERDEIAALANAMYGDEDMWVDEYGVVHMGDGTGPVSNGTRCKSGVFAITESEEFQNLADTLYNNGTSGMWIDEDGIVHSGDSSTPTENQTKFNSGKFAALSPQDGELAALAEALLQDGGEPFVVDTSETGLHSPETQEEPLAEPQPAEENPAAPSGQETVLRRLLVRSDSSVWIHRKSDDFLDVGLLSPDYMESATVQDWFRRFSDLMGNLYKGGPFHLWADRSGTIHFDAPGLEDSDLMTDDNLTARFPQEEPESGMSTSSDQMSEEEQFQALADAIYNGAASVAPSALSEREIRRLRLQAYPCKMSPEEMSLAVSEAREDGEDPLADPNYRLMVDENGVVRPLDDSSPLPDNGTRILPGIFAAPQGPWKPTG